jgi:hypothetical protein
MGLIWIMHVEADLLDGVGDVGVGEHQVLEGPSEAPEVSQISNRRLGLSGGLILCVHRCQNWLAVHQSTMPARSRILRAN